MRAIRLTSRPTRSTAIHGPLAPEAAIPQRTTAPRGRPAAILLLASLSLVFGPGSDFTGTVQAAYEEYVVNDDIRGEEHRLDPAGAPLPDGGFLVGWADNARGHTDVLLRRFAADGNPVGSPFRVNTDNATADHRSVVLTTPGGGALLAAWVDHRHGLPNVYARALSSADGSPLAADVRVTAGTDSGTAIDVTAATQSDGRSLVAWTGRPTQYARVSMRLLSATGAPLSASIQVSTDNPSRDQGRAAVAAHPNGGWIVAWDEATDRDHDVFFRLFDPDLNPVGGVRRAHESTTSGVDQLEPALLARASDFLIVWRDGRGGVADLWGRWFGPDGTPEAGSEAAMREASDSAEDLEPSLRTLADGRFALSWLGGIENRQRVFARFFAADRTPLSGTLLLSDPPVGVEVQNGTLIPHGTSWVHVWADDRTLSSQIYRQNLDASGSVTSSEQFAWSSPASTSQVFPDVALFPDGSAVVVYGDLESGQLNIKARFLDTLGRPVGESFQINEIPVGRGFDTVEDIRDVLNNFAPAVAACETGFVATWAIDQEGGRLRLFGQLFDRAGGRIGSNFSVLTVNPEGVPQYDARPAMRSDGSFLIAWRDNSSDDTGDVFYRNYSADGLPLGSPQNVADEGGGVRGRPQQSPAIAISPFNEAAVAWIDRRGGGWDIYSQRIAPDGTVVGLNEAQNAPDGVTIDQLNPSIALGEDRTVTIFEEQPLTSGLIRGRLEVFESLARGGEEVEFDVNLDRRINGLKQPQVGMERGGRFIVIWGDEASEITHLWAQRYDASGSPIGERYSLTQFENGSRVVPRLAVSDNVVQLVWTDSRREKGWDVIARRVDWDFSGGPVAV
ncbi:MAG: hypothetical protein IT349_12245, partial [Candidatus Eisenbacteria bacterium]|nr:hypothetical protein [Candidatus Eisenbacteria bacterium]